MHRPGCRHEYPGVAAAVLTARLGECDPGGLVDPRLLEIPLGLPRTKPRACNYAIRFARGELITIFDAEDRPDPLQLRRAVAAFMRLDRSVVCLQAKLSYYNARQNLMETLKRSRIAASRQTVTASADSPDVRR